MTVPVLECPCGMRLKAPGAKPGRTGRCPRCGGTLTVPSAAPVAPVVEFKAFVEPAPAVDPWPIDAWPADGPGPVAPDGVEEADGDPAAGYALGGLPPAGSSGPDARRARPVDPPRGPAPRPTRPVPSEGRPGGAGPGRREGWFPPGFLYPFRALEGVGVIVAVGSALWVAGTLVPEYCLALMADARKLGTPSMGLLVSLVTSLPVLFLVMATVFYWLQYLGRVLVSSGMGETVPPRPPDRNFDGFLNGIGPWFLWLAIGLAVPFAPLTIYILSLSEGSGPDPAVVVALGLFGLPYAVMALMITFLHDEPMAATPGAVIGTIARLGLSFLMLCLTAAASLGLGVLAFAAVLALRGEAYWAYVALALVGWMAVAWSSIVAIRCLGVYYDRHRAVLDWQGDRPRWGVAWKL